jgi:IS30 family transposase
MEYCQLAQGERYAMANMMHRGYSYREIARILGRSVSTISREKRRNLTDHDGRYRAEKAHQYAMARRSRSRKRDQYSPQEWQEVAGLVGRKWSPEQIAGRARSMHKTCMSKETIYRYIRRERRAGGQTWRHLRIVSKFGRKRRGSPATRGRLVGKRHISERPKAVELRVCIGHWEGDTVMGSDMRHCVLTLVERVSGYVIIKKLTARTKEQAAAALKQAIDEVKRKVRTVTLDNGTEFHDYDKVEAECAVKFYFATPYHSWERGTNENTNGLIRQYLPKRKSMASLTQQRCEEIALRLNRRPRKRHGYKTPEAVLYGI